MQRYVRCVEGRKRETKGNDMLTNLPSSWFRREKCYCSLPNNIFHCQNFLCSLVDIDILTSFPPLCFFLFRRKGCACVYSLSYFFTFSRIIWLKRHFDHNQSHWEPFFLSAELNTYTERYIEITDNPSRIYYCMNVDLQCTTCVCCHESQMFLLYSITFFHRRFFSSSSKYTWTNTQ